MRFSNNRNRTRRIGSRVIPSSERRLFKKKTNVRKLQNKMNDLNSTKMCFSLSIEVVS